MLHALLPHLHVLLANDSSCSTPIFPVPGSPGLYDNLCTNGDVNITALTDFGTLLGNIIRIVLALSGALGVVFIIVGGIFYVTSAGDPGRLKRAKDIVTNTIIGLVVVSLAYAVVTFIAAGIS